MVNIQRVIMHGEEVTGKVKKNLLGKNRGEFFVSKIHKSLLEDSKELKKEYVSLGQAV